MLSRIASRWGRLKRATMPVTVLLVRGSASEVMTRVSRPITSEIRLDVLHDVIARRNSIAYSIGSQRTELNVAIGWLVKLSALRYKYQGRTAISQRRLRVRELVIIVRVRKEKEGETPKSARCDNEHRFPRKFKRCGDREDSFVIRRLQERFQNVDTSSSHPAGTFRILSTVQRFVILFIARKCSL
ncbi:hypothetical protein HZH68_005895 [Vespula germanica]|uniref:Uncharacterized protein n=1 Tax=Vespula germanica TaxID=30212 RepID=A0A834KIK0_VESGE|nr:hypothetical protein HZH68_005895 [Vespula germanica]